MEPTQKGTENQVLTANADGTTSWKDAASGGVFQKSNQVITNISSTSNKDEDFVFKFSRLNLPQQVQDRLADEAEIQAQLSHDRIPKVIEYYKIKKQSIVHMARSPGIDLEKVSHQKGPLSPKLVVSIAI